MLDPRRGSNFLDVGEHRPHRFYVHLADLVLVRVHVAGRVEQPRVLHWLAGDARSPW
jgi:hypothetical protein